MIGLLRRAKAAIDRRLRRARLLARQQRSAKGIPVIPEPPIWAFPPGMTIGEVGRTGVRIVDNFCSAAEAEALIEIGRQQVKRSTVIGPDGSSILHDYRTSSDVLIRLENADDAILQIVERAAALLGLPVSHSETFSLTRYSDTEYYKSHLDHDGSLKADRLYTVLLYLNDLKSDEGGGTRFHELNMVTQPVRGRAVVWVNSTTDKKPLQQSLHSSLPVTNEQSEKWVAQMWFRSYRVSDGLREIPRTDPPAGEPLTRDTELPPGISVYEES